MYVSAGRALLVTVLVLTLPGAGQARAASTDATSATSLVGAFDALSAAAPRIDDKVLQLALNAASCAIAQGTGGNGLLTVIDYSRPSIEPRLWVFDLQRKALLFEELVAHGMGSGGKNATRFSNEEGSLASSVGLFTTSEVYSGKHGRSLRLDGLEEGFNDNARNRAIVLHAAQYVNTKVARALGRIGRSWGCPAVRPAIVDPLIDTIKEGSLIFVYYPHADWLKQSRFIGACRQIANPTSSTQAGINAEAVRTTAEARGETPFRHWLYVLDPSSFFFTLFRSTIPLPHAWH
jgi:L,D-transpeptidase catalytic domain